MTCIVIVDAPEILHTTARFSLLQEDSVADEFRLYIPRPYLKIRDFASLQSAADRVHQPLPIETTIRTGRNTNKRVVVSWNPAIPVRGVSRLSLANRQCGLRVRVFQSSSSRILQTPSILHSLKLHSSVTELCECRGFLNVVRETPA